MAKYNGIPPFTGTRGPLCIYKMYGRYYLRSTSSLTGKRVKKDPAFRKTMQFAALMAKASRIASAVYAALPAGKREHLLYRKLTGEAMQWLKYQWKEEDIIAYLLQHYTQHKVMRQQPESVSLNPPFKHKTKRLRDQRSIVKLLLEEPLQQPMFGNNFYRRLYLKQRKQENKKLESYPWAEHLIE